MASESSFSGPFGFDTPEHAEAIEHQTAIYRKNPILQANELFAKAVTQYYSLIGFAAMEATQTISRVLPAFAERGSSVWRHMLHTDDEDVLSYTNKKGFELVRLFLTTPHISYQPDVEELYEESRGMVVRSFAEHLAGMPLSQICEVYGRIGLRARRDGTFGDAASLRRVASIVH